MKTLTLVCNFVLLGFAGVGILTSGLSDETGSKIIQLLAITVAIMNVFLIAGSTIRTEASEEKSITGRSSKRWSSYVLVQILATILNAIFLVIVIRELPEGSGSVYFILLSFIILTPVLSTARIVTGKWTRFKNLIKPIFTAGIIVTVLFAGTFIIFRILIGNGIRENIRVAQEEYPGKAEDALLAYLADSTKTPQDRTSIAVWTLGQIRSRKALPVLETLYKDDPEGRTCHHGSELCQYEIHKAIVSIQSNWMGAKEKNVFGSWSRLNR